MDCGKLFVGDVLTSVNGVRSTEVDMAPHDAAAELGRGAEEGRGVPPAAGHGAARPAAAARGACVHVCYNQNIHDIQEVRILQTFSIICVLGCRGLVI